MQYMYNCSYVQAWIRLFSQEAKFEKAEIRIEILFKAILLGLTLKCWLKIENLEIFLEKYD